MEQAKTREEYRKLKSVEQKKTETESHPKKMRKLRIRLIPIWLRLVLLIVLSLIFMTAGAAVGYGALGGGKTTDVFKISTWTHIHDLVYKK